MIEKWFLKTHRLARTQTILDIALKDDAIGLSESECLVNALQGCAVGGKSEISSDQNMKTFYTFYSVLPGEYCWIDGTAVLINNRECGS